MLSGFRLLKRKLLECIDDFMRVFCDVNVRKDPSDLAFFVNYECHPFRMRAIFTEGSVGPRDPLIMVADQREV